jgi:nucleotide-binding universal stress UspA family protein
MSTDPADAAPTAETAPKTPARIFLVIIDDSPELKVALRYACLRAKKTSGRVALLSVIERGDFQQWMGVNELMQEEARQEAEQALQRIATDVQKMSGAMPVLYVREGERRDELLKLIDEEPSISILVLGAATGQKGPGPLVSALTSKFVGKLRVPITIVPGNLSFDDVDHIA